MNLIQRYQTKNDCYKKAAVRKPAGIMLHETGAANKKISRYVGDGDDVIGYNKNKNYWNVPGFSKCAHAFIGELADGSVGTVQTLPFDWECWLSGTGTKGKAANANRNGYIQYELCRGSSTDRDYFDRAYKEMCEFTAYLCKLYDIPVSKVIDHSEGYKLGIANDHDDVLAYFKQFGIKSMSTVRADIQKELDKLNAGGAPSDYPQWPDEADGNKYFRVIVSANKKKASAEKDLSLVRDAGFRDAYIKYGE